MPARPYTTVSCAVSLDGRLDDASPERLILSGQADLDEVDVLRAKVDAILVGAGTIRADNPRLLIRNEKRSAAREAAGRRPHPLRVTLTATGDLDPAARFFTGQGTALVYAQTAAVPAAEKALGQSAVVIDAGTTPFLAAVLHDLKEERGVASLLVEGGSRILRDLLAADLADELRLAIAPFFVGDEAAPRFALPASYPQTRQNPLTLVSARRLENLAILHYRRAPA